MPQKTNEQIQREYSARSIPGQFGTSVLDLSRMLAHGASIGATDDLLPGGAEAQREAELRTGKIGKALSGYGAVAGAIFGPQKIAQGAKAAYAGVRALPTAARLVGTAGAGNALKFLTGRAGPGLVPVAEAISKRALGWGAVKGAGALGALGAALGSNEVAGSGQQEATKTAAKTPAPTIAAATRRAPTLTDHQGAILNAILSSPDLSMRDLRAVTGMIPAPPRAVNPLAAEKAQVVNQAANSLSEYYQLLARQQAGEDIGDKMVADALDRANRWATLSGTDMSDMALLGNKEPD